MNEKVYTYQYGEYKIELKPSLGNFELVVNGEVMATTKGKFTIQVSSDIYLTATLPSGEEILAIKNAKFLKSDVMLFVGQELKPV